MAENDPNSGVVSEKDASLVFDNHKQVLVASDENDPKFFKGLTGCVFDGSSGADGGGALYLVDYDADQIYYLGVAGGGTQLSKLGAGQKSLFKVDLNPIEKPFGIAVWGDSLNEERVVA